LLHCSPLCERVPKSFLIVFTCRLKISQSRSRPPVFRSSKNYAKNIVQKNTERERERERRLNRSRFSLAKETPVVQDINHNAGPITRRFPHSEFTSKATTDTLRARGTSVGGGGFGDGRSRGNPPRKLGPGRLTATDGELARSPLFKFKRI